MNRKEIVTDFFRLISEGKPKEGLKYFTDHCVQHNPYIKGGMDKLFDAMAAVQKEQSENFTKANILLRHTLEQGDTIAVHTQILYSESNPSKGGLRQVHIFTFGGGDKIAEYWDITQVIEEDMPNAANAFG